MFYGPVGRGVRGYEQPFQGAGGTRGGDVIPGVSLSLHAPATHGQPFGLKRGGYFVMLEGVGWWFLGWLCSLGPLG